MKTPVTVAKSVWLIAALSLTGCAGAAGDNGDVDSDLLTSSNEQGTMSSELSAGAPIGTTLKTTSGLNLRTGAGIDFSVRLVIPSGATVVTVNRSTPSGAWYNIKYNGVTGWSYGSYLTTVATPTPTPTNPLPTTSGNEDLSSNTPGGAILRAKSGVGFSYYWGHGSWLPGAASASGGACFGNCPSCSHSGRYGADCSGYIGKIWEVPSSNSSLTSDSHPYSTASFDAAGSQWRTVARSATVTADALVYNTNGAGHIFLYESGDGWGSMWAYEAKGCSYGIIHDLRSASSAYKAIRHY